MKRFRVYQKFEVEKSVPVRGIPEERLFSVRIKLLISVRIKLLILFVSLNDLLLIHFRL